MPDTKYTPMRRFEIGERFMSRGKAPTLCTVTDIHTTSNSNGDIVKLRYVATHEFCGQTVTDYEVVEAAIAIGIALLAKATAA